MKHVEKKWKRKYGGMRFWEFSVEECVVRSWGLFFSNGGYNIDTAGENGAERARRVNKAPIRKGAWRKGRFVSPRTCGSLCGGPTSRGAPKEPRGLNRGLNPHGGDSSAKPVIVRSIRYTDEWGINSVDFIFHPNLSLQSELNKIMLQATACSIILARTCAYDEV